jgi:phage terminase large subunit-like protein
MAMWSLADKREMLGLAEERQHYHLDQFFPADGPSARAGYPRHLEFFRASADHRELLFLAGNRAGKSTAGCYALSLHLTGLYPDWWEGRRFAAPIHAWAVGETAQTTRDILQAKLLGSAGDLGSGLLPRRVLGRLSRAPGSLADAYEQVQVAHVSGGTSVLGFKSYVQQRESFQGTAQEVILLDEEAPMAIRTECLLRTMTVDGLVMHTFTPLMGLSVGTVPPRCGPRWTLSPRPGPSIANITGGRPSRRFTRQRSKTGGTGFRG